MAFLTGFTKRKFWAQTKQCTSLKGNKDFVYLQNDNLRESIFDLKSQFTEKLDMENMPNITEGQQDNNSGGFGMRSGGMP